MFFFSINYLIILFIKEVNIRHKFFLFLIIILLLLILGLYYQLDGIVFLFLISEFSVVLIFIVMFSQLYSYANKTAKSSIRYLTVLFFSFNYMYYDISVLNYKSFYQNYNNQLNDYYYIYNYLFEKQIIVTFLIIFIITFYSLFFILLYFNLKKAQNIELKKLSQLTILRKQSITHQANNVVYIRSFQK